MKNSDGYPGYNVPVNISISRELQNSMLQSIRTIILKVPQNVLDKQTEERLADSIAMIDHIEKPSIGDGEFYEFMRQEIEGLTKKLKEYEK